MPILTPNIRFSEKATTTHDTAVLLVNGGLSAAAKANDKKKGGLLAFQLDHNPDFKGECGQMLTIALPPNADYARMILVGVASPKEAKPDQFETAGGKLASLLTSVGANKVAVLNADEVDAKDLSSLLLGIRLGSYSFDIYKTKKKDDAKKKKFETLTVVAPDAKKLTKLTEQGAMVAESVALVRDLVNDPPNKLYPESFAAKIKSTLTPLGVKVQILDDKALKKMGMGCLLAVGQASEHLPRLVVMSWDGAGTAKGKKQKPLAFVGKGITFDSGGLNVKPYEGMMDMKMDMGGAATVTGLMAMLAKRKCKVPVVAVVALAENAISDEATRPSDIVTSYSGKTVEILNTDAEGRLVLADALTYIQQTFDPKLIVDLATLTGAIMISLGLNYCGAFVNDNPLWEQLEKSSAATGEKIWRMPLDEMFRREMDSPFADIKNIGAGRYGGSCTAAAFLGEFIDAGRPWAHLDIAGVAMSKATPTCPVPFASGYGIKLLNKFVEDFHG
jgi:leucyl aminopeptidase